MGSCKQVNTTFTIQLECWKSELQDFTQGNRNITIFINDYFTIFQFPDLFEDASKTQF